MPSPQFRRALTLGGLTAIAAAAVVLMTPSGHGLDNVWMFLAYLVPFILATETIASLRAEWFIRWRLAEITGVASFALVFCAFVPRMFDRVIVEDFDGFYALMRALAPLLILAIALQHRLGGGHAGAVRRIAYASLLVMLSGIEDLLFWVWRGDPVPDQWDWADHMTVLLGHVASRPEAYVFIGLHLMAALMVLLWRTPVASRTGGQRRQGIGIASSLPARRR
jgi:hypothetical protein